MRALLVLLALAALTACGKREMPTTPVTDCRDATVIAVYEQQGQWVTLMQFSDRGNRYVMSGRLGVQGEVIKVC